MYFLTNPGYLTLLKPQPSLYERLQSYRNFHTFAENDFKYRKDQKQVQVQAYAQMVKNLKEELGRLEKSINLFRDLVTQENHVLTLKKDGKIKKPTITTKQLLFKLMMKTLLYEKRILVCAYN